MISYRKDTRKLTRENCISHVPSIMLHVTCNTFHVSCYMYLSHVYISYYILLLTGRKRGSNWSHGGAREAVQGDAVTYHAISMEAAVAKWGVSGCPGVRVRPASALR